MVLASEPLDEHPDWRLLGSGELLHVDGGLEVSSHVAIDAAPAHPMEVSYLHASPGAGH